MKVAVEDLIAVLSKLSTLELVEENQKAIQKGDWIRVGAISTVFGTLLTAAQGEKNQLQTLQARIDRELRSVLDHGIPPMDPVGVSSESGTSVSNESQHAPVVAAASEIADEVSEGANLEESQETTCLIQGIRLQLTREFTNGIWTHLAAAPRLTYRTKADIVALVSLVMKDVSRAIEGILGPDCNVGFNSELSTFGRKCEVWTVLVNGAAVGAVEVKKPGKNAMNEPTIIGQCFDYMHDIRGFDGLDNVFCILTTMTEWRILWLQDTDEAARSTAMPPKPPHAIPPLQALEQLLGGNLPPLARNRCSRYSCICDSSTCNPAYSVAQGEKPPLSGGQKGKPSNPPRTRTQGHRRSHF